MALPQSFKAMVVSETADKTFNREIKEKSISDLPAGELIVEVKYSSLNYKDALSATGNKGVTRKYPHTPGIDAAGVVVDSSTRAVPVGEDCVNPLYKPICPGVRPVLDCRNGPRSCRNPWGRS